MGWLASALETISNIFGWLRGRQEADARKDAEQAGADHQSNADLSDSVKEGQNAQRIGESVNTLSDDQLNADLERLRPVSAPTPSPTSSR